MHTLVTKSTRTLTAIAASTFTATALAATPIAGGDDCTLAPPCTTLAPYHTAESDFFGQAVDISGDTAVVGASGSSIAGAESGVAYVFQRDSLGWLEQARLTPDVITPGGDFADSVAIHGNTVVVGAPSDDTLGNAAGSAFVYQRDQYGLWSQAAKLLAPGGDAFDRFGRSVSVSGDFVVVGADKASGGGAVYVYRRAGNDWNHYQTLQAGDATASFGFDVAIAGKQLAVGAWQDNDFGPASGAVYTFYATNVAGVDVWQQQQKLTAQDANDGQANAWFGSAVGMTGTHLVVGAYGYDTFLSPNAGAAYAYRSELQLFPQLPVWKFCEKLLACDLAAGDNFGFDVAVEGNRAIIGSPQNDDFGSASGAAYTFTTGGFVGCNGWIPEHKLLPDAFSVGAGDQFGRRVAVQDGLVLAGSHLNDASAKSAGLLYVQHVKGDCLPAASCGALVYGQDITPYNDVRLSSVGSAKLGQNAVFAMSDIPPGAALAYNGLYLQSGSSSFLSSTVLVHVPSSIPSMLDIPAPVVLGQAAWTLPIPILPGIAGIPFYQQGVVLDPSKPDGFALTNGLRFVICGP